MLIESTELKERLQKLYCSTSDDPISRVQNLMVNAAIKTVEYQEEWEGIKIARANGF